MVDWNDPSYYVLASFLCVLGAAGGLALCYAVSRLFRKHDEEPDRFTVPTEQAKYMREVRDRNMRWMAAVSGRTYYVDDDGASRAGEGSAYAVR